MLLVYGECHQIAATASRLYAERFPTRFHPAARRFVYLAQRARDTGCLQEKRGGNAGRPRPQEMLQVEERIMDIVEEDPTTSTRRIAEELDVSHSKVWLTLRENQLYPYHVQRVQALMPQDHPQRVQFCEWLLQQNDRDENFTKSVLVTDEATFTRNGIHNFRNTHVWDIENPHAVRRTNFQERFSLNVWAGIVNGMLIGPFILPDRMNGLDYLHFLQNNLPELLEDVPLEIRQSMWFLHDGAPPHFRREVRDYLNNEFPNRWIGRNGPISWPPRSPDCNPCDFYLWGYMKSLVFKTEVNTVEELRERIENAAEIIRGKRSLLTACTESWVRRASVCVNESNGDNFEQFL